MDAYQFAKEFINDIQSGTFDTNKESIVVFNKNILKDDPELKILNSELSKIGFILKPTEKPNDWTLKKLS